MRSNNKSNLIVRKTNHVIIQALLFFSSLLAIGGLVKLELSIALPALLCSYYLYHVISIMEIPNEI